MSFARLFFLSALLVAFSATAQVNTFSRLFPQTSNGGMFNFDNHAFQETREGRYVFCHEASDSANLYVDEYYEFLKTTREGAPLWGKRIFKGAPNGLVYTSGNTIVQTSGGGYLLGFSLYNGVLDMEAVLVKTDSMGNLVWGHKYPGEGVSRLFCVKQTADDGYIACGSTVDSTGLIYAWLFTVDAFGNFNWGKKFLVTGDTSANFHSVIELPGQKYVACGFSNDKALAVCVDGSGNTVWSTHGFDRYASFYDVAFTSDSGLVFVGTYMDSTSYHYNACVVKTDPGGSVQWQKGFQSVSSFYSDSRAWTIRPLLSGFAFVSYAADPIPTTLFTICDLSGTVTLCREYRGTYHTFNYVAQTLETCSDGGFAIVTFAGTYNPNYSTAFLKTDANGMLGCDGSNYVNPFVAINYPFASGVNSSFCGATHPYTPVLTDIPLRDSIMCQTINDPDPVGLPAAPVNTFTLSQNEPNPFSGETNITYVLTTPAEHAALEVYDARGAIVFAQPVASSQGEHTIRFSRNELPAGIYFYALTADEMRTVRKMIVQ